MESTNKNSNQDMIILTNLHKSYGDFVAVKDTTLNVKKGEFLTFLGSSGCGKTTTLRMIAGFENPTSGSIMIGGKHVEHLQPNKRDVNTVFQNYALFPHLTIRENIGFGLKLKKVKKNEIAERVEKIIKLVKLEEHADKSPDQLSGGQKQRVAIARAIVNNPKVLLLDEPLGALDLKLRKEMQLELKQLQQELNITFIYVTHDQEEALTMSDRIVVMNKGIVEQVGTAHQIYNHPKSKFVAQFIGETNLFENKCILNKKNNEYHISLGEGKVIKAFSENAFEINEKVHISIRPENIRVSKNPIENMENIPATYYNRIYVGNITKYICKLENGMEIISTHFSEDGDEFKQNETVFINWAAERAVLIKKTEEEI